ncbi:MAG TPA: alpha-galactosidase [Acholeplasmataceae bacterium]|jgi:alpha-galactosidase|nr:alpha-galactosidase [Acholeplasmataceae bacterium]
MIKVRNNHFLLETKNTVYILHYNEAGLLIHDYYGKKIPVRDFASLEMKTGGGFGSAVLYEGRDRQYVGQFELEASFPGVGDFREPLIALFHPETGHYCNFKYVGHELTDEAVGPLPASYGADGVLRVDLCDAVLGLQLEIYYKVFAEADVISRYVRLVNESGCNLTIERMFSLQIDLRDADYVMMTFEGDWAKERHVVEKELVSGIYVNDAKTGASSNIRNPLVILRRKNCDEHMGSCFGFNLVYSGNHKTTVEVTPRQTTRLLSGINDYAFNYTLPAGGTFIAPEAVMTYSDRGLNLLSQNFHAFVNNHIIRGKYKNQERPVLLNTWEASYFNFDKKQLLKLARTAKEAGIELFVLDDGWFGRRNDDTSSLGDWDVNTKKLPGGLAGLARKINELGMDFGLWVEPEMVNEDSDLYRAHPDWAVRIPGRKPALGRNQLVLDLTNPTVCDYLIEKMSEVFSSCKLKYVKWDYNRNITDMHGKTLANQGEFFHRYIMGLYRVMAALTERFPDILFEGCASGGNRFDLGILCFFPQIWTSDNTDYLERIYIQRGTSYGYPLSAITNHVSSVPNHQTLRVTPLSSRFNLACFGNLGYELDLTALDAKGLATIKKQIAFYKANRRLFQYGTFYRANEFIDKSHATYWYVVDANKDKAVVGHFQELLHPAVREDVICVDGLEEEALYRFTGKPERINIKIFGSLINYILPFKVKLDGNIHNLISRLYRPKTGAESYLVYGSALKHAGVRLNQQFMGTGFGSGVRVMGDFGSRLYMIEKHKAK